MVDVVNWCSVDPAPYGRPQRSAAPSRCASAARAGLPASGRMKSASMRLYVLRVSPPSYNPTWENLLVFANASRKSLPRALAETSAEHRGPGRDGGGWRGPVAGGGWQAGVAEAWPRLGPDCRRWARRQARRRAAPCSSSPSAAQHPRVEHRGVGDAPSRERSVAAGADRWSHGTGAGTGWGQVRRVEGGARRQIRGGGLRRGPTDANGGHPRAARPSPRPDRPCSGGCRRRAVAALPVRDTVSRPPAPRRRCSSHRRHAAARGRLPGADAPGLPLPYSPAPRPGVRRIDATDEAAGRRRPAGAGGRRTGNNVKITTDDLAAARPPRMAALP